MAKKHEDKPVKGDEPSVQSPTTSTKALSAEDQKLLDTINLGNGLDAIYHGEIVPNQQDVLLLKELSSRLGVPIPEVIVEILAKHGLKL